MAGSSPRVRSRQRGSHVGLLGRGIISACAEQTRRTVWAACMTRDHLRVCGADKDGSGTGGGGEGSSPRVRSRPHSPQVPATRPGIIPACAEQTMSRVSNEPESWDHLRVCGADLPVGHARQRPPGSSPRVRSRRGRAGRRRGRPGIISACAEQTRASSRRRRAGRDHLRVCGADITLVSLGSGIRGSSPRVRSRRGTDRHRQRRAGIISACAEQTHAPARC